MFSKLAIVSALSLSLLAAATPAPVAVRGDASSCSTGPIQCCDSVQKADSAAASGILSLLGIVLQDVNVPVGLTCSPITVIGAGTGNECSAQAVCCQDNSHGSLISIGCVPVTL